MRKKLTAAGCLLAFVLVCILILLFCRMFTTPKDASVSIVEFVEWERGEVILADGTEAPYDFTQYALPEASDRATYRFYTTLPELSEQAVLVVESSSLEIILYIDEKEAFRTASALEGDLLYQTQNILTLDPESAGSQLRLECRYLGGGNIIFPPLLRIEDNTQQRAEDLAYAHSLSLPTGAFALALVLICGMFFLSLARGTPEWSLLPLMVATAGLMVQRITQGSGYYFLPLPVTEALSSDWVLWAELLALTGYALLNRRRSFWKYLGRAAACTAVALLAAYLVSLAQGSYLSRYINVLFEELLMGYYGGILYWVVGWMVWVCTGISAYSLIRTFVQTRSELQALALKTQLATESQQAIERQMRETAALRHEAGHQIAALSLMYQQGDMEGLGNYLRELQDQQAAQTPAQFSENFTVNAILHSAAGRAVEQNTRFSALAPLPETLPIPEADLCGLLMNMLDNALEACQAIPEPSSRWISFQIQVKSGYLAVKCQNARSGALRRDKADKLSTTKANPEIHGFGLKQMEAIAGKYQSMLDIQIAEDTFTVQTALRLPQS